MSDHQQIEFHRPSQSLFSRLPTFLIQNRRDHLNSKIKPAKLLLAMTTLLMALLACSPSITSADPTPTPLPEPAAATTAPGNEESAPTNVPTAESDDEFGDAPEGWTRFVDEQFGLSFLYPQDWNGPEVHRWETGVAAEVGTDTVYPFGTGLAERDYSVPDAYFISVQYTENTQGWDWQEFIANQPWVAGYVDLLEVQNGEFISTPRSLTIRQRELEIGQFTGLEYIATLSETAQTEIFYSREALLFDEELNSIRVTGSPNNVQILEDEGWRAAYERVDKDHQAIFELLLSSVIVLAGG